MSVGKPPTPVGYADPGVVAHADPVADDRAASVADDRAAFVANGRVDPVADGRADPGTDAGADPGVVARAESTRRMSVGKPPTPVGCADQTTNCVLSASSPVAGSPLSRRPSPQRHRHLLAAPTQAAASIHFLALMLLALPSFARATLRLASDTGIVLPLSPSRLRRQTS